MSDETSLAASVGRHPQAAGQNKIDVAVALRLAN